MKPTTQGWGAVGSSTRDLCPVPSFVGYLDDVERNRRVLLDALPEPKSCSALSEAVDTLAATMTPAEVDETARLIRSVAAGAAEMRKALTWPSN